MITEGVNPAALTLIEVRVQDLGVSGPFARGHCQFTGRAVPRVPEETRHAAKTPNYWNSEKQGRVGRRGGPPINLVSAECSIKPKRQ